jgi:hypothetical protein
MKIINRSSYAAEIIDVQSDGDHIEAHFADGQLIGAVFIVKMADGSTRSELVPTHYEVLLQELYDAEKKA